MISITVTIYYLVKRLMHRFEFSSCDPPEIGKPSVPHIVLHESDIGNRHLFFIGDVHGCIDELDELLSLAEQEIKGGSLLPIFVGDLTNKGPANDAIIKKIRRMDAYAVRGNHDEAILKKFCLKLRHEPEFDPPEKYQWTRKLNDEDVKYLSNLPYTITIPSKNILVVHAGIVPGVSLENHNITDLIKMRSIEKENGGFKPLETSSNAAPWASFWNGPEHVIFGHDARRRLQHYPFATGIDTGCVYGNMLSGYLVDSDRILQIRAKKRYKPTD